jgi:hypothetical protein
MHAAAVSHRTRARPKRSASARSRASAKPHASTKPRASAKLRRYDQGRRWIRVLRGAPGTVRILAAAALILALSLSINWIYQIARKPSELLFPVSGALNKTPAETWRSYAPIFRRYATATVTPELLAALAQAEGSGNPLARTYWRWSWGIRPFEVYRPASSSVGMYQMTDGAFAEARNLCIRDHRVARDGLWNDGSSCWFDHFYWRLLPSHAVELTSAFLDAHVSRALTRNRIAAASSSQKQHLALVIHLCGAAVGDLYARRGFRLPEGQRCGDHDPRIYLRQVDALKAEFMRLAGRESS